MKVWVRDIVGYDAGGGNAEVFATEEAAKGSVEWAWEKTDEGWEQPPSYPGSTGNSWVIYEREVQE